MKKITSVVLIALMTLTIVGSSVSQPDQSTLLTNTEMVMIQGGLKTICWIAIVDLAFNTGMMAAGAASIVGFGLGFVGVCFATAGVVGACG